MLLLLLKVRSTSIHQFRSKTDGAQTWEVHLPWFSQNGGCRQGVRLVWGLRTFSPEILQNYMGVSENEGVPYFGGPHNKDPTI